MSKKADYVVVIILLDLFISAIPPIQLWPPIWSFLWLRVSLDFSFIFRKGFAFYESTPLNAHDRFLWARNQDRIPLSISNL